MFEVFEMIMVFFVSEFEKHLVTRKRDTSQHNDSMAGCLGWSHLLMDFAVSTPKKA